MDMKRAMGRVLAVFTVLVLALSVACAAAMAEGSASVRIKLDDELQLTDPQSVWIALYRVGSKDEASPTGWSMDADYASADFVAKDTTTQQMEAALVRLGSLVNGKTPAALGRLDASGKLTLGGLDEGVYFGMRVDPPRERYSSDEAWQQAVKDSAEVALANFGVRLETVVDVTPKVELVTETSVEKVWDDDDDRDGLRPASIRMRLSTGEVVTLGEDNGWSATVSDLPKYDTNGRLINYTWEELLDGDSGYTLTDKTIEDGVTTFTNTHQPEETEASVKKVWDDADDQDGARPDSLTVNLMNGTTIAGTVVLSEDNDWTDTLTRLPKNENGSEIDYYWSEADLPDGYSLTGDTKAGTLTTLTNHYAPGKVSREVRKIWQDANNQDGVRPASITVTLLKNDQSFTTVTLDEANGWKAVVSDLDEYTAGVMNRYTWAEAEVSGYEAQAPVVEDIVTTLTNRYVPETVKVGVKKVWEDDGNRDGLRPTSLTVTLSNGDSVTLNEGNGWEAWIEDLPRYENATGTETAAGEAREIEYTWTEPDIEGYALTNTQTTGSAATGVLTTLTNTHEPEKTRISVRKVWDDADDQDGARPGSVTVQLKADNVTVDTAVLSAENGWMAQWADLNVKQNGQDIAYTVAEEDVPAGYTVAVDGSPVEGFVVTNSYTPEKTSRSVSKVWDDADDQDGLRPESVSVQLLANGEALGSPVTLNEINKWAYTWERLDRYSEGVEIKYTIQELSVPAYAVAIAESGENAWTVTNTHEPLKTRIDVEKVWEDADDQDGLRPKSIDVALLANGAEVDSVTLSAANQWSHNWEDLPVNQGGVAQTYTVREKGAVTGYTTAVSGSETDGFTITNTHTPETTEIKGSKDWKNAGDENPPQSVTVQLYADGVALGEPRTLTADDDWTGLWTELPKKAAGRDIVYTVQEQAVTDYTGKVVAVEGGYVITNTYTPGKTQVSVRKAWDDADDQDGLRPDSVTVRLYANGAQQGGAVVLDETNKWAYTWTGLDAADEDGAAIEYTVSEDAVAGYDAPIITGDAKAGYTVTNPHTPETTSIQVKKAWEDGFNRDRLRPESVTVALLANGVRQDRQVLSEANGWAYTWQELPVNDCGAAIEYTVEEIDVPEGYEAIVTGDAEAGFTVTNTHEPETTRVAVSKVWDDGEDQDELRPATITVALLADGEAVEEAVLSADNEWAHTFTNLVKKNADGDDIAYTVDEVSVEGYESSITGTAEAGFIITNHHTPSVGSLQVTKQVTVNGGATTGTAADGVYVFTVTGPNDYQGTIRVAVANGRANSARLENLRPGVYTITEQVPANMTLVGANGRQVTVTGNDVAGVPTATFTNNINVPPPQETQPVLTELSGRKIWVDNNDEHGLRPASIELTLLANGEALNARPTWTSQTGNTWEYEFTGLPTEDEDGNAIRYEVRETPVEYYTTTVSGSTITNTLVPRTTEKYTNLSGVKTWNDNNNEAGNRPRYITVYLLRDGQITQQRTVTAQNNWNYSFESLPVDDGYGHTYTYSVREEPVDGYFMRITGNRNIVNTRLPDRVVPPPFEENTEEELEDLTDLFDYDTPLFGNLLGTGQEDAPITPYIIAGVGALALVLAIIVGGVAKRRGKKQKSKG